MDNSRMNVINVKTQMVVLYPCLNVGVSVKFESLSCFPAAVIDGIVDVAFYGVCMFPAGMPCVHIPSVYDGALLIVDGNQLACVSGYYLLVDMNDDFATA